MQLLLSSALIPCVFYVLWVCGSFKMRHLVSFHVCIHRLVASYLSNQSWNVIKYPYTHKERKKKNNLPISVFFSRLFNTQGSLDSRMVPSGATKVRKRLKHSCVSTIRSFTLELLEMEITSSLPLGNETVKCSIAIGPSGWIRESSMLNV